MLDELEQIRTIKSQTLQLLADVTAAPKPSYYIDGQSVSWQQYLAQLQRTVDWCDARLIVNTPFEFQTRAES